MTIGELTDTFVFDCGSSTGDRASSILGVDTGIKEEDEDEEEEQEKNRKRGVPIVASAAKKESLAARAGKVEAAVAIAGVEGVKEGEEEGVVEEGVEKKSQQR
jgi:hypothetical protein